MDLGITELIEEWNWVNRVCSWNCLFVKRCDCRCDSGLPALQQAPVGSGIIVSAQSLPWPCPSAAWPLPSSPPPAPAPCVPAMLAFLVFLPHVKHMLLRPWRFLCLEYSCYRELTLCFAKSFTFVLGLKDSLTKETTHYTDKEQFPYLIEDYLT